MVVDIQDPCHSNEEPRSLCNENGLYEEEDLTDEDLLSSEVQDESCRYEHFRCVADPGQSPIRVDKFLVDRMGGTTRNRIQQAAEAGAILVNGKAIKSNYKVKPLDVITLELLRPRRELEIEPEDIPLNIVFEDADLLVVNKPAGLVVHPGHGNYTGTLLNALAYYFRNDKDFDANDPRLGLVHRIDKDTSGLLLVAKNAESKVNLSRQFFHKTTERSYRAMVWGRFDEATGTIDAPLGRDPKDRLIMTVYPQDNPNGKQAITHYSLLETLAFVSWIECRLETGRTHQIRAHMRHLGHPLFADERYGGDKILRGNHTARYKHFVQKCFNACPRQALHAKTLGFTHPKTGQFMSFDSELPDDLQTLLSLWQAYCNEIV